MKITYQGNGAYKIESNEEYHVDIKQGTCTCPAYTYNKTRPCKHIKQVMESLKEKNPGEINWTD